MFLYFTFTVLHTIFVTVWFYVVLMEIFEGLKVQGAIATAAAMANNETSSTAMNDRKELKIMIKNDELNNVDEEKGFK